MHIRNLTQQFEIDFVIRHEWHLPEHKHTHYELQYIIKGSGQHIINGFTYPYDKGDLFLLAPQDRHYFVFREKSSICIIKFHERFFRDHLLDGDFQQVLTRVSSAPLKAAPGDGIRQHIIQLMDLIIAERRKENAFQGIIVKNALALALSLMARSAVGEAPAAAGEKIQAVLNYIDKHITDRDLLKTQQIADAFHISKTYFNQYFSKATGSSYKKYVSEYALKLIAHQLLHGDKTLAQLSDEFGYTDESHLSNAFKAHFGQSPSAYKKAGRKV